MCCPFTLEDRLREAFQYGLSILISSFLLCVHVRICTSSQRGTTLIVKGLFSTLPVRLTAFKKSLKREYGRLITLLQAYCLVCTGVTITCTNTTTSGSVSCGGASLMATVRCLC